MINYSNGFKNFVYALSDNDETMMISKWYPVFQQKIPIDTEYIKIMLSLFMEFYSRIDGLKYPIFSIMSDSEYITSQQSLDFITKNMLIYIEESKYSKLKIEHDYINIITGKKGIMLENNIKFEDGKILNTKIKEQIDTDLKNILDESIEYILNPEYRKNFIRTKKLNRILNN